MSISFECMDSFYNNIGSQLPTKKYLGKLSSLYDMYLFSLNTDFNLDPGCNFAFLKPRCQYLSPHSFLMFKNTMINNDASFSLLLNWRSVSVTGDACKPIHSTVESPFKDKRGMIGHLSHLPFTLFFKTFVCCHGLIAIFNTSSVF